MTLFAELLTLAKKINNYEIDPVTGVKVLWSSTVLFKALVPAGKRWILLGGVTNRNVSSTLIGTVKDASDDVLGYLVSEAAGTGVKCFPESDFFIGRPWILDADEYVDLTFGTAQDAGSFCSCVVLEIDV